MSEGAKTGNKEDAKPADGAETAQRTAEEIIDEFETPTRPLAGSWKTIVSVLAILTSLYALYGAAVPVPAQVFRGVHVMFVLVLTFLCYPMARRWRDRVAWADIALAALSVLAIAYMLWDFEEFIYRAVTPNRWDLALGVLLILLVLEATRRTVGWILPIIVLLFIVYAFVGPFLPEPWAHRGYDLERLVGLNYMTLDGIFGVPIDVSSSFIILFTIYGAVLEFSGAGKFFVDFSFAAMGKKRSGAGRTVTLASFLLGTVSGSGVATTVTLGSIAYPMLKKAGYDRESAGAILSAGGIGAVLSPPVLGAASFLIAEILKISYLEVLMMATVPTLLYYLSIFLMIELDSRKMSIREVDIQVPDIKILTRQYWFHFTSLVSIVVFMAMGFTSIWAVFWSTLVAVAASFLRKDTALSPGKLAKALESGAKGILSVASTCASAGIIVGVVALTGLGLKFSGIIIDLAGGNLLLTLIYTALILLLLGLALPITASYIVAAVMTAPALIKLGVPEYAAHMFIFYYAVLSEVSPPVALSPMAASAITGGNPFKTMWVTWKYTLPAFIVPFMFSLNPSGVALLMKGPVIGIIWGILTSIAGVTALVAGVGGWVVGRANLAERTLLVAAALLLFYSVFLWDIVGFALFGAALGLHLARRKAAEPAPQIPGKVL